MRTAFEGSELVKIDCRGLHPSDYKKIGAKLKVSVYFLCSLRFSCNDRILYHFLRPQELVPCVLLSFDDEQILMWRGREWKSMYRDEVPRMYLPSGDGSSATDLSGTYA